MMLYIVRHALAGQHGDPQFPDDALRPLTKKGHKQFRKLAKKLARRGFAPAVVATSPLVRCRQTAELIVERVCAAPRLVETDALQPGSRLEELISWSNEQGVDELAWVGHSPDVEGLAASLLGSREGALSFVKGAVAAIRFEGPIAAGRGELRWLATPAQLGC